MFCYVIGLDVSCSGYAKTGRVSPTMVRTVALWLIDPGTNPTESTISEFLELWDWGSQDSAYAPYTVPEATVIALPLWPRGSTIAFLNLDGGS